MLSVSLCAICSLLLCRMPDLWALTYLPVMWFLFAQGAKRCHDLGRSGWFQFIPLYVFWMLFQDGKPLANRYGASPKNLDRLQEFLQDDEY